MKTKSYLWFSILLFVTSCSQSGNQPTVTQEPRDVPPTFTSTPEILPTVTPACISPEPTQDDIDRALGFTGPLFDDWERSYTVSEDRVSVSWFSNSLGAVAFMEVLIFPCGYEEPDLNNYFNDENWANVFANYQSYTPINECRSDIGLRLYEFSAVSVDVPYMVRYWVMNDTNNRVISFMLLMAGESFAGIDSIGYSLFPQLSNCS
jgi:hypothetical protein